MIAMYETTEWFQPLPRHIRGEGFVLLYPKPDLAELHERCTRRLFLSLSWISLRNVYVRGEEGAKMHLSVVKTEEDYCVGTCTLYIRRLHLIDSSYPLMSSIYILREPMIPSYDIVVIHNTYIVYNDPENGVWWR